LRKTVNNNEIADKVKNMIKGYFESFKQRPSKIKSRNQRGA